MKHVLLKRGTARMAKTIMKVAAEVSALQVMVIPRKVLLV
jgi:hypothetical protein